MNRITQEAKKRQSIVKLAERKGGSHACKMLWGKPIKRQTVEQAI